MRRGLSSMVVVAAALTGAAHGACDVAAFAVCRDVENDPFNNQTCEEAHADALEWMACTEAADCLEAQALFCNVRRASTAVGYGACPGYGIACPDYGFCIATKYGFIPSLTCNEELFYACVGPDDENLDPSTCETIGEFTTTIVACSKLFGCSNFGQNWCDVTQEAPCTGTACARRESAAQPRLRSHSSLSVVLALPLLLKVLSSQAQ